jgi:hypothetical protein
MSEWAAITIPPPVFVNTTEPGNVLLSAKKNEAPYLLEANIPYKVQILVKDGLVRFRMNDIDFFEYQDPNPLTKGYFGFRSTWSRHKIDHIHIYQLNN